MGVVQLPACLAMVPSLTSHISAALALSWWYVASNPIYNYRTSESAASISKQECLCWAFGAKEKKHGRGGHGRAWASGTTLSHSISTALLGKMFPVVLIPFASLCLLHSSAAKTKAMLDWSLVLLSRQEEDRRFSPEQAELSPIKTGRYRLVLGGACMAGCIMSPDPAGMPIISGAPHASSHAHAASFIPGRV